MLDHIISQSVSYVCIAYSAYCMCIGMYIVSIYLYLSVCIYLYNQYVSIGIYYRYVDIYRRLVLSYRLYYYCVLLSVLSIYITMYIYQDSYQYSYHAVQSLGGIDTKLASNHIWLSLSVQQGNRLSVLTIYYRHAITMSKACLSIV